MATTTAIWSFASDAQGLADAGSSASVAFAYVSADQAVQFTQATKATTSTEFARRATTGQTWMDLAPGLPFDATVTAVQLTAWQKKLVGNTKLSSHSLKARLIDSGGASILSADLLNASLSTTPTDGSYGAQSAGSQVTVNAGSQAATTDVRLELEYAVTTSSGGGSAAVDQRFDEFVITLTFTEPTRKASPMWDYDFSWGGA